MSVGGAIAIVLGSLAVIVLGVLIWRGVLRGETERARESHELRHAARTQLANRQLVELLEAAPSQRDGLAEQHAAQWRELWEAR